MFILRILFLILTSRVSDGAEFSFAKNSNNYGPYVLYWKKYESCQGPKSVNLATMIPKMINNKTDVNIFFNITFFSNVQVNEIKIHVSNVNGIQKSTLWNYKVDTPCQHFAIASVMAKYLPMQKNCVVKKSELYFVVNVTPIAHEFFGSAFFYGEFLFKVLILSRQGNVMCSLVNLLFSKKL